MFINLGALRTNGSVTYNLIALAAIKFSGEPKSGLRVVYQQDPKT
jgi:hypothetical protein